MVMRLIQKKHPRPVPHGGRGGGVLPWTRRLTTGDDREPRIRL